MTLQKFELELDVPEGCEFSSYGELSRHESRRNQIDIKLLLMFDKPTPSIQEVPGPRGWPMLRWAFKTNDGTWWLEKDEPKNITGRNEWHIDLCVTAEDCDWTPPPEIAHLPPEKSLVNLTHTCRWMGIGDGYAPTCGGVHSYCDVYRTIKKYCPECGREVETMQ